MRTNVIATFFVAVLLAGVVQGQISTAQSGEWRDAATWVGGIEPTSADDVVISSGHQVSVDDATSECRSVSFGANDATIAMSAGGELTIYGDFTLFGASHNAFSGWASSGAYVRFAGSADQTLRGWSTSGGSTSFRDVIIDKSSGKVTTGGNGMRLCIQESLEIISGTFELAEDDDLEERFRDNGNLTGNSGLDITVLADGRMELVDGAGDHWICSETGSTPIGKLTVWGVVELNDASASDISFSDIDIKDGGTLQIGNGLGSNKFGPKFNPGTITVEPGGTLYTATPLDVWFPSAVVDLQDGGVFRVTSPSVVFPPTFYDNGRVRYDRNLPQQGQTIDDRDYNDVEFSYAKNGNLKNWTLAGNRQVTDSLTVNHRAELVLAASTPQTLTVNGTLRLTGGSIDNSDPNVTLAVGDEALISRDFAELMAAPQFDGRVDVLYTSLRFAVTAGPELPADPSVLRDLTIEGDKGVTLSTDVTVNGTLAAAGSALSTDGRTVFLGPNALISETHVVQGSVQTTRSLAQSVGHDFGGLGLEINASGAEPGATTVTRVTGTAQDLGGGVFGVLRYFDIAPSHNSGLDATLVCAYLEEELNGVQEDGLSFYSSDDGGTTWVDRGGAVDAVANTVTLAGIDGFSMWTLGLETTPPVCGVPADQDLLQCEPTEICLPVSCTDDHDPAPVMTIADGPGELVGGQWCYTPSGAESFAVTIRCEDIYSNFCESLFNVSLAINSSPHFTNCPTEEQSVSLYETFVYDLVAVDPDPGQTIIYSLGEGTPDGVTVDQTGHVEWSTAAADVCGGTIEVIATDDCQTTGVCQFSVCVTNNPPYFTVWPDNTTPEHPDTVLIGWGDTYTFTFEADDDDPGPYGPIFNVIDWVYPVPPPTVSNDPGTHGDFEWVTEHDPVYVFTGWFQVFVEVNDAAPLCPPCAPENADTVDFWIRVVPFQLTIEKREMVMLGQREVVAITMADDMYVNADLAGFDFLIRYDNSVMMFLYAEEGAFLGWEENGCEWEYFTYRYGPNGNCGPGACPSGVLRVVAMAETTGGNLAHHPECYTNEPGKSNVLVLLHFLVACDATLECNFAPIRWVWYDCADNSVSDPTGEFLYISREVFDFAGFDITGDPPDEVMIPRYDSITNADLTFPTVTGAPIPICDVFFQDNPQKGHPWRLIYFYNGGLDLACADLIDDVGDINLNDIPYEIADAVMFTNYFVEGVSAFGDHVDGSVAASDTNKDGITLSVADLVYLIRVVIGDILPYAKVTGDGVARADYSVDDGLVTVSGDVEIGGAALVVKGEISPRLLVSGMEMSCAYDGADTRIVIVPDMEAAVMPSFSGQFLSGVNGELVSIELATADGMPLLARNVPSRYSLSQNFPNPFNPGTTIEFAMPRAGSYRLTIFNIQGQAVDVHRGTAQAPGVFRYEWDGSDHASGVYLYRLEAGSFTQTRKMLLLK